MEKESPDKFNYKALLSEALFFLVLCARGLLVPWSRELVQNDADNRDAQAVQGVRSNGNYASADRPPANGNAWP